MTFYGNLVQVLKLTDQILYRPDDVIGQLLPRVVLGNAVRFLITFMP